MKQIKVNKIIDGVYEICTEFWNRKLSLYFVNGYNETLIIDSGVSQMPESIIFPNLEIFLNKNKKIDFLLNTHRHVDHAGGNQKFRERYKDIKIFAHINEIEGIENFEVHWNSIYGNLPERFKEEEESKRELKKLAGKETWIDVGLTEDSIINIGGKIFEIISTPGHTEGSISLINNKDRIIFTGESIFGNGVKDINGKIICPPYYSNAKTYIATLEKISRIDADIFCTSHDGVLKKKEFSSLLKDSKDYFSSVNRFIISFLSKHSKPINSMQIAEEFIKIQISYDLTSFVFKLILGHLEYLEEEGFIKRIIYKKDICWLLNI